MLQPSPTKDSGSTYGGMENADFLVEGELTVTITLREYRDLIANNAEAKLQKELDETRSRWMEAYRERDKLKSTVADLSVEVSRLRSMLDKATSTKEDA
jgi:hypothetical protein